MASMNRRDHYSKPKLFQCACGRVTFVLRQTSKKSCDISKNCQMFFSDVTTKTIKVHTFRPSDMTTRNIWHAITKTQSHYDKKKWQGRVWKEMYKQKLLWFYFEWWLLFSWQTLKCSPNNYLTNTWWNPLFNFLERNVQTSVPCSYSWPITWPPACLKNPCKKYSMVQSTREEWQDPDTAAVLPDNPPKWYSFIQFCWTGT